MTAQLHVRITAIEKQVLEALRQAEEAQRRVFNLMRPAKVSQIDHEKHVIKAVYAKDADGRDVETCWIPWTTRAGKIKEWNPPSVGEQIILVSPSGNIGAGTWGNPGGFSNANPKNHDQDGEYRMSIGGTSITVKDGQILMNTKHFRVETPSGKVEFDNQVTDPSLPPAVPSMDAADVPMS